MYYVFFIFYFLASLANNSSIVSPSISSRFLGDIFGDDFCDDLGDIFGDDLDDALEDIFGDTLGDDFGDTFGDGLGDIFGDTFGDVLFDTYVREVEIVYITPEGTLDTYKDYALQSEMDEIGYKNEKLKREHAITQKKAEGKDTFEDEQELARFVEANEERGLTEEYYRIMSSLSLKAKRARKEIIDKMKLLEARDRGDILNDMIAEQMEDLRLQLERLESLVYPDGTPKKGDDLEIAEDIRKWKETTRAWL
jgi:hypothetical protein